MPRQVAIRQCCYFFFNDPAPTEIYTLSLHDALPISAEPTWVSAACSTTWDTPSSARARSEEHTSELQSLRHLVCRLLLEKKNRRTSGTLSCPSPGKSGRRARRRCAPAAGRASPPTGS